MDSRKTREGVEPVNVPEHAADRLKDSRQLRPSHEALPGIHAALDDASLDIGDLLKKLMACQQAPKLLAFNILREIVEDIGERDPLGEPPEVLLHLLLVLLVAFRCPGPDSPRLED